METSGLKNLIVLGAKPRKGIPGVILANFSEIVEARELGWTWLDIAKALERPGDVKAMSTAFGRIKKRIDSGKLKSSKGIPSPAKANGTSPPKKILSRAGEKREKQQETGEKGDFDFQSLPQIF